MTVDWLSDAINWLNDNSGAVQAASAVVLALTLIAVAYYAKQTRKQAGATERMAEEMREQRLLAMRPILLLSPSAQEQRIGSGFQIIRLALPGPLTDTTPIRIINIGTGIGVDIRVPYKLAGQGPSERVIDYLSSGSDDVEHNFYLAPKEGRSNQRTLKITYNDVFGNLYESRREFHKEPDSQDYRFTPLVHREVSK